MSILFSIIFEQFMNCKFFVNSKKQTFNGQKSAFFSFAFRVARCTFSVSRCARQFFSEFRVARCALRVLGFSLRSAIYSEFCVARCAFRVARSRFLAALGHFFLSFAFRVARCALRVARYLKL